jgi:hypothetical protein
MAPFTSASWRLTREGPPSDASAIHSGCSYSATARRSLPSGARPSAATHANTMNPGARRPRRTASQVSVVATATGTA